MAKRTTARSTRAKKTAAGKSERLRRGAEVIDLAEALKRSVRGAGIEGGEATSRRRKAG